MSGTRTFEMVKKIENIMEKLKAEKTDIVDSLEKVEAQKLPRDVVRKTVLLKEVKGVISELGEVDRRVVQGAKIEVFDKMREEAGVKRDIEAMIARVKSADRLDMVEVEEAVETLACRVEDLGLGGLARCLKLKVVGCPSLATSLAQDALHLAAPALQPTAWVLEAVGGGHQSRYLEVRVRATSTSTPVTEMLLRRMEVRVVGVVGQALEQSTMEDKVARCLAELVVSSPPCLRVRVRRPEVAASLAVTLLGTNVQGSPLALHSAEGSSSASEETYGPDSTIGILELADLQETALQEEALEWEPTAPAPPPAAGLATKSSSKLEGERSLSSLQLEEEGTPSVLLDQLLGELEGQGSHSSPRLEDHLSLSTSCLARLERMEDSVHQFSELLLQKQGR